jgi:hypothetical protein
MAYNRVYILFVVIISGLGCMLSCENEEPMDSDESEVIRYDPVAVDRGNAMDIFVHYMPWFEDVQSSYNGSWGIHWTMATQNPEITDENGRRQIASHYYPQIGPYASGDPDVIEYHLLLMKYAGITGVLIDWYGSTDVNDYASIRENSEKLIGKLDAVGLNFAIVYEDRTVESVFNQNPELDPIDIAAQDMSYIEDHYFTHDNYIRIDDWPLLLVFGPEYFHDHEDWSEIMLSFGDQPLFLILNGASSQTAPSSSGEYIWVNNTSLDYWYGTAHNFDYFMGGAYPGFIDFYEEGGWGSGFDWQIDHNDGATFREGLQKADANNMEYLQLITWNDFGEGTMIEPTDEFGYTFLEEVQEFADIEYDTNEFALIYKLFEMRKEYAGNTDLEKLMDQSFYYLVSLQTEKATALIDSLNALK